MGASNSMSEKRVVIIGGGYGGLQTASSLKGKCQVTLIDPKDGMHANTASPRACVETGFARKTFIPYAPVLGDSFKKGWVKDIKPDKKIVILEETLEEIPYDYLVIATGTTGQFPTKIKRDTNIPDAIKEYEKLIEQIKHVNKITVIGGGAAGTEIVGEIKVDYPEKEVTLIHSSDVLIGPMMKEKFRNSLRKQLEALGVKLILGEKVTNLDELPLDGSEKCIVKTDKGSEVEADLVFVCIGLKINIAAYSSALSNSMDEHGCLKVRPTLQVEGHDNIFAIGDCSNINKVKMAYYAGLHSNVVVKNIEVLATTCGSLKIHKEGSPMMVVTLGRTGGALQAGPAVFGSFVARKLKEDMMIKRIWSTVGLKYNESHLFN
ncbi:ferroptosis suppressor protein 1-like [Antedon mediterranea]|uniref:ferroptosis suppressor protein 1-like n=1 Tax=Antedon mediterranea TaxID=105859 RepID=UPI003AF8E463